MKKEYDFSKGEKGKFFNPKMNIHLPVYLDKDNLNFVRKIAEKKQLDLSAVVNNLIKGDQKIAELVI